MAKWVRGQLGSGLDDCEDTNARAESNPDITAVLVNRLIETGENCRKVRLWEDWSFLSFYQRH